MKKALVIGGGVASVDAGTQAFRHDGRARLFDRSQRQLPLGLDIDDCIEQAMIMAQQIKAVGRDYPVPMEQWR